MLLAVPNARGARFFPHPSTIHTTPTRLTQKGAANTVFRKFTQNVLSESLNKDCLRIKQEHKFVASTVIMDMHISGGL